MDALDRTQELERKLAAKDKTIAVLIERQLEARSKREATALQMLEQNITLEKIVTRKTQDLAKERAELESALSALKLAQVRMLQMQKMESIGQLAAGMAHEINTPAQFTADNLTFLRSTLVPLLDVVKAALAVTGTLRRTGLCPEGLDLLDAKVAAADLDFVREQVPLALDQCDLGLARIAAIVGAMKTFSHTSNGILAPEDLASIIQASVTVAQNVWKPVADLEVRIEPALPPVPCLRDEIGQLVLNLVVNAAHAIEDRLRQGVPGQGRITIAVGLRDDSVEIRVTDNGTGIPEAIRDRVFEPFFTTKVVGRGSGQGLALAYATVVEKHHGQIFLEAPEGGGACFVARWPLQAS